MFLIPLTRSTLLTVISICVMKLWEPYLVRIIRFAVRVDFRAHGLTHLYKSKECVRFLFKPSGLMSKRTC